MNISKLQLSSVLALVLFGAAACSADNSDVEESLANISVESADCKVVYAIDGQWGSGFTASVAVTNKGAATDAWVLEWSFPSGQKIQSLWDATHSQDGAKVRATGPSWGKALGTGATAKFGFNGSGSAETPTSFTLNGKSCGGTGGGSTGGGSTGGGSTGGGSTGGGSTGGNTGGGTTTTPGGSSGTCSAPAYTPGKVYSGGDRVNHNGKTYACKPFPYSGWCGLGGAYAPDGSHGSEAWTVVTDCGTSGGNTGGNTGGGNTGGGNTGGGNTGGGNTGGGNTGGGTCSAPAWAAGTLYRAGDRVTYNGRVYYAEHENPGYDPVISSWFWEADPTCGGGSTGGGNTGGGNTGGGNTGGGNTGTSGFASIVSEATFNSMFPNRNGFYTYQGIVNAMKAPVAAQFANTGNADTNKREVAAFLANMAHETGNLVYIEEIAGVNNPSLMYCAPHGTYPCAAGKRYYGRGPIQLSWNYNYGAAGAALGLPLLENPDLVARDSAVAWQTALWFWMTQSGAGRQSAHAGIVSGSFGETIRTINGSLECNGGNPTQVNSRIENYRRFCQLLGVDPGANLSC